MTNLRVHETFDAGSNFVAVASAMILIVIAVTITFTLLVKVERRAFQALCRLT